jgi:membrane-associated phospholipid phosphatase
MRYRLTLLAASMLAFASPARADEADWGKASDIGRDGLVIAALAIPAVQGDWEGAGQSAVAMAVTSGTTDLLKRVTKEERPDHSNDRSFPSGHTSMSFAAAASLEKRYGWEIGLPAHAVAAFVGVARVKANKHFWHDVIAGAAIGEAAGWLIVSKKNDKVRWLPWGDAHGAGAMVDIRF